MKICIYRGTNEIGGNCVEIATDAARVLFDFGLPLSSMEEEGKSLTDYKVNCSGIYADEEPSVNAIFITHNHPDHYGMLPLNNPKIPVYMSKTLHEILIKIQPLLPGNFDISHLDIRDVDSDESIKIGDLTITVHPVDHAPAACAYEISDGKKSVLYTGDIRFHSNQSWKSWKLSDKVKKPDYLIMEGTRLSRTEAKEKYPTEDAVYKHLVQILRNSGKAIFISLSSQNLDRLVSVIKACLATGKIFVIDPYTAALFDIFHELSEMVPTVEMVDCVKIYYGGNQKIAEKMIAKGIFKTHSAKKITIEEIAEFPEKYVIKYNRTLINSLLKNQIKDYDFIYSMWHGYLERKKIWEPYKEHLIEVHTSGHAQVSDLQEFVKKISPAKIIPIHTECKDSYADVFSAPILSLNDNEPTEV